MNLKSEIGIEINFSLDFTLRVFVPCSGYQINRTLKDVDRFRTRENIYKYFLMVFVNIRCYVNIRTHRLVRPNLSPLAYRTLPFRYLPRFGLTKKPRHRRQKPYCSTVFIEKRVLTVKKTPFSVSVCNREPYHTNILVIVFFVKKREPCKAHSR